MYSDDRFSLLNGPMHLVFFDSLHYIQFYLKRLTVTSHSYTGDSATGSNSGLSVSLKDTSTRAGIEPPTP